MAIDIKTIDREKDGLDFLDEIRDGRSTDLDTIKVAAVLKVLIATVNYQEKRIEELELAVAENMKPPVKRGRKPQSLYKKGV